MPVDVIYIAGEGRSGSTLLDRILGSLRGVCSFNEVYELWGHGFIDQGKCSCMAPISQCPFWRKVSYDVMKKHGSPRVLLDLQNQVDHSRYIPRIYTGIYGRAFRRKLCAYKEVMRTLYFSMAEHSGCEIIVDSSKLPSRPLIMSEIPEFNVYLIHVVRDVCGVVYSWCKHKWDPSMADYLPRYKPSRTVMAWALRNILSELLARRMPYLRLVYEDWARRPKEVLQSVVDSIKPIAGKTLPFASDTEIYLETIHSVRGNPNRFVDGMVSIKPDDAWDRHLDWKIKLFARTAAFPLLWRYGYLSSRTPAAGEPVKPDKVPSGDCK